MYPSCAQIKQINVLRNRWIISLGSPLGGCIADALLRVERSQAHTVVLEVKHLANGGFRESLGQLWHILPKLRRVLLVLLEQLDGGNRILDRAMRLRDQPWRRFPFELIRKLDFILSWQTHWPLLMRTSALCFREHLKLSPYRGCLVANMSASST